MLKKINKNTTTFAFSLLSFRKNVLLYNPKIKDGKKLIEFQMNKIQPQI